MLKRDISVMASIFCGAYLLMLEWSCSHCRARNSSWWWPWSEDLPESDRRCTYMAHFISV